MMGSALGHYWATSRAGKGVNGAPISTWSWSAERKGCSEVGVDREVATGMTDDNILALVTLFSLPRFQHLHTNADRLCDGKTAKVAGKGVSVGQQLLKQRPS